MIVDGTNMILGRLASNVAKKLMQGEEVHLINAEKLVVSGTADNVVADYMQKRRLQQKATPDFSPKWPKVPHLLVRRVVRGMLPFKKAKGKAAFRKLRVYVGNPQLKGETIAFKDSANKGLERCVTIEQMCRRLGATW